jgi:hypothetical protein
MVWFQSGLSRFNDNLTNCAFASMVWFQSLKGSIKGGGKLTWRVMDVRFNPSKVRLKAQILGWCLGGGLYMVPFWDRFWIWGGGSAKIVVGLVLGQGLPEGDDCRLGSYFAKKTS